MTPKSDHRMLAIGLAVAAAACLAAASFSTSWLANPNLSGMSFGPRGCTSCCVTQTEWSAVRVDAGSEDACAQSNGAFVDALQADQDIAKAIPTSAAFAPMGWVTLVACALAALGLLAAAALAALGKTPELPMAPTTVALLGIMIGLVSGCVFVATKPGPPGFVGVAWGFWAFGGGAVAGIAAAQMLAKVLRPPDPDLLADAMNPDEFST